jgi:hypothetical protein
MAINIKPSHEGRLREATGTPSGQNIPLKELMQAKRSKNPARRKQATFAVNARKWQH